MEETIANLPVWAIFVVVVLKITFDFLKEQMAKDKAKEQRKKRASDPAPKIQEVLRDHADRQEQITLLRQIAAGQERMTEIVEAAMKKTARTVDALQKEQARLGGLLEMKGVDHVRNPAE